MFAFCSNHLNQLIKSRFEGNGDQHFEKSPCRCVFLMLLFIQLHGTKGCKASEFDACPKKRVKQYINLKNLGDMTMHRHHAFIFYGPLMFFI